MKTEETGASKPEISNLKWKLEHFNKLAVGRELRMIELKRQINELTRQLGQPPPYALEFLAKDGEGKRSVTSDRWAGGGRP